MRTRGEARLSVLSVFALARHQRCPFGGALSVRRSQSGAPRFSRALKAAFVERRGRSRDPSSFVKRAQRSTSPAASRAESLHRWGASDGHFGGGVAAKRVRERLFAATCASPRDDLPGPRWGRLWLRRLRADRRLPAGHGPACAGGARRRSVRAAPRPGRRRARSPRARTHAHSRCGRSAAALSPPSIAPHDVTSCNLYRCVGTSPAILHLTATVVCLCCDGHLRRILPRWSF